MTSSSNSGPGKIACQLFEAHLPVRDLDRAVDFYKNVLGLEMGTIEAQRRIAFFFPGGWGKTMIGLWEKPEAEMRVEHIAFGVSLDDLPSAIENLRRHGVQTTDFFGGASEIPSVLAWMPAASIYFNDPDGHLLEYIAMMPGKPKPELGIIPWRPEFAVGGL